MTHQDERSAMRSLVELAIEHGTEAMAAAFTTLMNHAMQIEREQVLKAESHQRTADRQGYANGFKPKTMNTRVGQLELRVPQTRGYRDENGRPFYPKALDRGVRSERAMILAMAEMYVQGVSTGGGSAPPTASSGSTGRSNDAPASQHSSQMRPLSSGSPPPSSPKSVTTGKLNVPT